MSKRERLKIMTKDENKTKVWVIKVGETIFSKLYFNQKNSFSKDFIYLFSEREEGREKEEDKYQYVVASHVIPTGDLACNPGMCPDWELN